MNGIFCSVYINKQFLNAGIFLFGIPWGLVVKNLPRWNFFVVFLSPPPPQSTSLICECQFLIERFTQWKKRRRIKDWHPPSFSRCREILKVLTRVLKIIVFFISILMSVDPEISRQIWTHWSVRDTDTTATRTIRRSKDKAPLD